MKVLRIPCAWTERATPVIKQLKNKRWINSTKIFEFKLTKIFSEGRSNKDTSCLVFSQLGDLFILLGLYCLSIVSFISLKTTNLIHMSEVTYYNIICIYNNVCVRSGLRSSVYQRRYRNSRLKDYTVMDDDW